MFRRHPHFPVENSDAKKLGPETIRSELVSGVLLCALRVSAVNRIGFER
jgi:hypothetical protein